MSKLERDKVDQLMTYLGAQNFTLRNNTIENYWVYGKAWYRALFLLMTKPQCAPTDGYQTIRIEDNHYFLPDSLSAEGIMHLVATSLESVPRKIDYFFKNNKYENLISRDAPRVTYV